MTVPCAQASGTFFTPLLAFWQSLHLILTRAVVPHFGLSGANFPEMLHPPEQWGALQAASTCGDEPVGEIRPAGAVRPVNIHVLGW